MHPFLPNKAGPCYPQGFHSRIYHRYWKLWIIESAGFRPTVAPNATRTFSQLNPESFWSLQRLHAPAFMGLRIEPKAVLRELLVFIKTGPSQQWHPLFGIPFGLWTSPSLEASWQGLKQFSFSKFSDFSKVVLVLDTCRFYWCLYLNIVFYVLMFFHYVCDWLLLALLNICMHISHSVICLSNSLL